MLPDDPSAPPPHLIPVDHATLHPCPQCGARPWLQGVIYYKCAPCGYRDGPTPGEIRGQREGKGTG
jgi:tRNA(Ile2) C34 agmatinyltransferase TiaS